MSDGGIEADWFSKPGDSLRSLMQRRGTSAADLADHVEGGISTVRGLLDGSLTIDDKCARVLAKVLGGTPIFWLNRQTQYERRLERAVEAATLHAEEWLDRVPVPGPRRRGSSNDANMREQLRRRLTFFNVPTIDSWHERYGRLLADTRFRTSPSFESIDSAVLLWLRRGELEADLATTRAWSPGNLQDRLDAIRNLSRIGQPSRFLPKLRALLAEAGVAVVVVKTPHGCHASGASRLVASDKAMILLSFRHRADDQFWFTVFHEIGHLVLHGANTFVDADGTPETEAEREANDFARRSIVPENRFSEFIALPSDKDSVVRFSVSLGISAGLTVGQMQYRRMIPYNRLNALKRYWKWSDIDPALI
jgi:HTH-type transcriptional regulator/antitoxin HigA